MPYCSALYNHVCVSLFNNIEFKPCCRFGAKPAFPIKQFTFDEYNNSHFVQQIKRDMEDGWAAGCGKCKAEEMVGKTSLRQTYNTKPHTNGKINFIEMSLSNECNLSCKMCNNVYSTKWQSIADKNPNIIKWMNPRNDDAKLSISQLLDDVDLSSLVEFKYLGGEPFITPEIEDIIGYLETRELINGISLMCNTNATFFPSKLIPKLLKFREVNVSISVDGIEDLCNYIRTGKSWSVVYAVINKWIELASIHPSFKISIHHTSQAYNVHQFDQIKQLANDLNVDFSWAPLIFPKYLSYSVLPKDYVDSIIIADVHLNALIKAAVFDEILFDEFKQFTMTMDLTLNTSITNVIPQLDSFLKK